MDIMQFYTSRIISTLLSFLWMSKSKKKQGDVYMFHVIQDVLVHIYE